MTQEPRSTFTTNANGVPHRSLGNAPGYRCNPGAVDVRNLGEVNDKPFRFRANRKNDDGRPRSTFTTNANGVPHP